MVAYYQSVVYEEKKVTYWALLLVLAFIGMIFVIAYLMKDVLLPWFPVALIGLLVGPNKINAGFRAGAAVNFAMGVATLESMRNNTEVFFGEKPVKISHEARDNILADPLGFVSG